MNDQVCVCGHLHSVHTGMSGSDRYCKHLGNAKCYCPNFRESLPWPDDTGAWWTDWALGCPVFAHTKDGINVVLMTLEGFVFDHEQFLLSYGPARFTKLLETNPYGETP